MVGTASNWDPGNAQIRELCHKLFGGPGSTKDALEAAFNYLKDSLAIQKSKIFNVYTRFFYLLANYQCNNVGVNMVRPSGEDFAELLTNGFRDESVLGLHPFNYKETVLGEVFPRPDKILGQWRKAGFHSNRVSAAAYAFVMRDVGSDFAHVGEAWSGRAVCDAYPRLP